MRIWDVKGQSCPRIHNALIVSSFLKKLCYYIWSIQNFVVSRKSWYNYKLYKPVLQDQFLVTNDNLCYQIFFTTKYQYIFEHQEIFINKGKERKIKVKCFLWICNFLLFQQKKLCIKIIYSIGVIQQSLF